MQWLLRNLVGITKLERLLSSYSRSYESSWPNFDSMFGDIDSVWTYYGSEVNATYTTKYAWMQQTRSSGMVSFPVICQTLVRRCAEFVLLDSNFRKAPGGCCRFSFWYRYPSKNLAKKRTAPNATRRFGYFAAIPSKSRVNGHSLCLTWFFPAISSFEVDILWVRHCDTCKCWNH